MLSDTILKLSAANTSKFKPLPENEKEICWRLAAIRRLRGLSQTELAQRVGITRNQLANIEAKRVPLRFLAGRRICEELDINPFWLADGKGRKNAKVEFDDQYSSQLWEKLPAAELFSICVMQILISHLRQKENPLPFDARLSESRESIERLNRIRQILNGDLQSQTESKVILDNEAGTRDAGGVLNITSLPELIEQLRKLTLPRGQKAKLADALGVTRQAVDQWLSEKAKPSAETVFALLDWVRKQSRHNLK